MADSDNPLSDLDIDVCNVRPAYEASLATGISEGEIEARVGWTREHLERDGATVTGASTYAHMAWMAENAEYAAFVLDAVQRHTAASLGVVGLACKTSATVAEALQRHGRYQSLTNRTARYDARAEGGVVHIEETRFGEPSTGSLLISDYTVLVAVQLLRSLLGPDVPVVELRSRRASVSERERSAWEAFAGAPIVVGAEKAALCCPVAVLARPVPSSDDELSAYFSRLLRAKSPDGPPRRWVDDARAAVERGLASGTPSANEVAKQLGVGARTLARRLSDEGTTFGQLLTEVRRERARQHLQDPELTLAEVAFLLGYRDHASFHRAFRRWFGATPAVYRAKLRGG